MRDSKQWDGMSYTLNIIICALHQIVFVRWVKWDWGTCQLRNIKCIKNLVGKFEGKKRHERLKNRREDNIRTVIREGYKVCRILWFSSSLCNSCSRLRHFVRLMNRPCVWYSCLYWPWLLKNITGMEILLFSFSLVFVFHEVPVIYVYTDLVSRSTQMSALIPGNMV